MRETRQRYNLFSFFKKLSHQLCWLKFFALTALSNQTTPVVDIVYLWVDGQDADWQAKLSAAQAALSAADTRGLAPFSTVAGRFRDNEELRYSLRALTRFFPQHGHIYVVTDNQTPSWLKPSADLTIIDHRDLMPAARLPTFDSGNIESYLHCIPHLREHFFYLNDDVFFGAPVHFEDWFFDDGIYVTWSDDAAIDGDAMRADSTALVNASRLSKDWLTGKAVLHGYVHTPRTFAHSPRPMLKSVMQGLEKTAPELFNGVRSTVFRAWDTPTIVSDFVPRWALSQGKAQVRAHSHLHVSTGDKDATAQLQTLANRFGELAFFCINDTTDDALAQDARLLQARIVLEALLPTASPFEH